MSTWAPRARARWRAASSSALLDGYSTVTTRDLLGVGFRRHAGEQGVDAWMRAPGGGHRSAGRRWWAVPSGAPRARRLANPLGFLCRRTSPFIRLSRADVVAANHQVGRPVLAIGPIGPIDHLGDELTRKTRLGRSQRTAPQPGELRPASPGRAAYGRCGTSG